MHAVLAWRENTLNQKTHDRILYSQPVFGWSPRDDNLFLDGGHVIITCFPGGAGDGDACGARVART